MSLLLALSLTLSRISRLLLSFVDEEEGVVKVFDREEVAVEFKGVDIGQEDEDEEVLSMDASADGVDEKEELKLTFLFRSWDFFTFSAVLLSEEEDVDLLFISDK